MTRPRRHDPYAEVVDDPKAPRKALWAAIASLAAAILGLGLDLPPYVTVPLVVVASFGGAYAPRNRKISRPARPARARRP